MRLQPKRASGSLPDTCAILLGSHPHSGARTAIVRSSVCSPPFVSAAFPSSSAVQHWACFSAAAACTGDPQLAARSGRNDALDATSASVSVGRQPLQQQLPAWRGFASGIDPASSAAGESSDPLLESTAHVTEGPLALYRQSRMDGLYRKDLGQEHTVQMLQQLYDRLKQLHPPPQRPSGLTMVDSVDAEQSASGGGSRSTAESKHLETADLQISRWSSFLGSESKPKPDQERPRGLYMYGGVGVGKTMLMDLLVAAAPKEFKLRRAHFHDFLLDVHSRLQQRRSSSDALKQVADDLASEMRVLALDEFFVTDVADATIMNRLCGALWDADVVLVSTSNRAPDALYEGGLQRFLFLPFIERLKKECVCHDMESGTDYRKLAQPHRGMYFTSDDREAELDATFYDLTNNQQVAPATIAVQMGRKLQIARAGGCISLFEFDELCGRPLAAADYIALAEHYQSVAISGVPKFTPANRPAAYRFMILIDMLYEHRVRVFCSAEGEPFELFENVVTQDEAKQRGDTDDLVVDDNLAFTKDRTVSRLIEMQSQEYLREHAERHATELLLALEDRKANPKSRGSGRSERGGLKGSRM